MVLENNTIIIVPLTLEELILRRDNVSHFADLFKLSIQPPILDEHMRRVYNLKEIRIRSNPDEWLFHTYLLIIHKPCRCVVGTLGFQGAPDTDCYVEIGYFMDPNFMNQGIMTQAVELVSSYVLGLENIKGIYAFTKDDNIPSHKVLDKCSYFIKYVEKDMILWERTL